MVSTARTIAAGDWRTLWSYSGVKDCVAQLCGLQAAATHCRAATLVMPDVSSFPSNPHGHDDVAVLVIIIAALRTQLAGRLRILQLQANLA
jgi:hypothetical protein